MTRAPDGVTTAAEVWNWLQRHRRPIPPQPWTGPAFRVVDSTAGRISYLALISGGQQLRAAFIPATLALRQDWRSELARLIRGTRMQLRLQLSRVEETDGPYPGEHRADAFRYGLELHRRYDALRAPKAADAGMRDTIAKLFPLPDYREPPALVPTVSFGDPAPYARGQAGPDVMMLGGMNRGSGKASAILNSLNADLTDDEFAYRSPITGYIRKVSLADARDCDSRIYKKLIEMGWTPPPGTTNTTKGE